MEGITPLAPTMPASLHAMPNRNLSPAAIGKQFEGLFASLLVKQMRQTTDGESLFGKDPGDVVGGLFDHYLGSHLTSGAGLGIAQMVRAQLEKRSQAT